MTPRPLDRDGRPVRVSDPVAWPSPHGMRSGRVVRVEMHGVPAAVVVADDSHAELRVRCAGLVVRSLPERTVDL